MRSSGGLSSAASFAAASASSLPMMTLRGRERVAAYWSAQLAAYNSASNTSRWGPVTELGG